MKNRPNTDDPPQHKTRRVILIQDKRSEVEPVPSDPSQVQSTHARHAFGVNRMKGNEMLAIEDASLKPNSQVAGVEGIPEPQLNSTQLEFVISSLIIMKTEVSKLSAQLQSFQTRIERLQDLAVQEPIAPRKKMRRKAQQIIKNFICPQQGCHKAYGSEVSLNLHIRLKHPGQQGEFHQTVHAGEGSSRGRAGSDIKHTESQQSLEVFEQNPNADSSK